MPIPRGMGLSSLRGDSHSWATVPQYMLLSISQAACPNSSARLPGHGSDGGGARGCHQCSSTRAPPPPTAEDEQVTTVCLGGVTDRRVLPSGPCLRQTRYEARQWHFPGMHADCVEGCCGREDSHWVSAARSMHSNVIKQIPRVLT